MRRLLLAAMLFASVAEARTEKTLAYPRTEAWAASVRFIRVDAHLKVTEKDADAGYVLFEVHEDGKTFRGSLELADVTEDGRHAVRFVLTIEDRPSWLELQLMGKLVDKLRAELGEPAPVTPPKDGDAPKDDDKHKDGDAPKGDNKHADKPPPPPDRDAPPISSTP
jgi:hypothetical protein